ncbi:MAG: hypothetical protein ABI620_01005 [Chloroflexota bacterium]
MSEPRPDQATPPLTSPAAKPTFEDRVESFARDVDSAGQRIGREAEAAGQRLAKDPGVQRAADTAARVWGLVVLAIGLWFLADVTIGMDMPAVAWGDIWPLGLILLGALIVVRGMARRPA